MLIVLGLTMLPVIGAGIGGSLAIHLTMGHGLLVAVTLSLTLARLSRVALLEGQRLRLAQEQSRRELAIVSAQNHEYDRFLAMLTHELRNALSTAALVVRRVQRLMQQPVGSQSTEADGRVSAESNQSDDPELSASLERASSSLRAASAVIDKVQVTRQFESGMPIEPTRALLSDRLTACIDRLAVHGLSVDIEPGISLMQDWTYVDLIVSNLLENADRYRLPDTTIHVRARSLTESPGQVELRIANRCVPGADVDPGRVFEKYWRDPHARSRRGAGLGLWLSRHAALALGGDLVCQLDGADIEFRLILPGR
jgi:signal transduction histidine kinase